MIEKGIKQDDRGIQVTEGLRDDAAVLGNFSLGDNEQPIVSQSEAILKLLGYFKTEHSTGDTCNRVAANHRDGLVTPYCTCAFQLACVLDMPGDTLLSRPMLQRVLEMLLNHPTYEITLEAAALLKANFDFDALDNS